MRRGRSKVLVGATPRRRLPIRGLGTTLLVLAVLALILTRLVFLELVRVRGDTMAPALLDGDILLIASLGAPARGDVVLLEAGDRAVLRRVVGLPGEQIGALDGVLTIDGVPLETEATDIYRYRKDDAERPVRQTRALETLPDGQTHAILGDHDGAARPWRLDVPEVEVAPGQLFVLCDNRRTCPLDELAGVVPRAVVSGVVRAIVDPGDGRLEPTE